MKTCEQIVMARVRRIHILRHVFSATACKLYGLTLLFLGLLSTVSVANVYANMPSLAAPLAFLNFVTNAVTNTELLVQIMLAGLVIACTLLARDLARAKHNPATFARV